MQSLYPSADSFMSPPFTPRGPSARPLPLPSCLESQVLVFHPSDQISPFFFFFLTIQVITLKYYVIMTILFLKFLLDPLHPPTHKGWNACSLKSLSTWLFPQPYSSLSSTATLTFSNIALCVILQTYQLVPFLCAFAGAELLFSPSLTPLSAPGWF